MGKRIGASVRGAILVSERATIGEGESAFVYWRSCGSQFIWIFGVIYFFSSCHK